MELKLFLPHKPDQLPYRFSILSIYICVSHSPLNLSPFNKHISSSFFYHELIRRKPDIQSRLPTSSERFLGGIVTSGV